MAGTLTISTLSDGTNSTSATNCIQGSAKAWVSFNGVSTASIRASYNVSSVTRLQAGDYTINFTVAMSDANYCVNMSSQSPVDNISSQCVMYNQTPTTSAFRMRTGVVGVAYYDCAYVYASVFR